MGSGRSYGVRKVLKGQEGLIGSGREGLMGSGRSYGVRKDLQGQEGLIGSGRGTYRVRRVL